MSVLAAQLTRVLPPGMHLPSALSELYTWMEENGHVVDGPQCSTGFLGDDGVTRIEFRAVGNSQLHYWFRHGRAEVISRLCVFCMTGSDGSMGAFWLAPDGSQKIVHLGSGSGSIMTCILADGFIDFMRLLAIGYEEIAWDDDLRDPPTEALGKDGRAFRDWIEQRFQVGIPDRGTAIVRHIAVMSDDQSDDAFHSWLKQST